MELLTELVSYAISELTIENRMSLMNQRRMFMVHFWCFSSLCRYHATNFTCGQWWVEWNNYIERNPCYDSNVGFFVEVDITDPSSLHDSHNDLPLAPEKILIRKSWLSPYAQPFNVKLSSDGREKLVETLLDKNRYICHYRKLKFYVNQGLKVRKLHRVIQFRQSKWLGDYISKNTYEEASNKWFREKFL